jgi:hypothetical protein
MQTSDDVTDHVGRLQERLNDPKPEVRALAILSAWDDPEPEFIPLLFSAAENDPDQDVRCEAIRTLGCYIFEGEMADYDYDFGPLNATIRADELPKEDFARVKEFLLGIYRDESKSLDERRFSVEALGFLSDNEVYAIIESAYAHPDTNMKVSAIFAMGRSGGTRWIETLRREMYSPIIELQWEAIRSAGEMRLTEAGKDLWRLTYADDREIQSIAIWALGESGWAPLNVWRSSAWTTPIGRSRKRLRRRWMSGSFSARFSTTTCPTRTTWIWKTTSNARLIRCRPAPNLGQAPARVPLLTRALYLTTGAGCAILPLSILITFFN